MKASEFIDRIRSNADRMVFMMQKAVAEHGDLEVLPNAPGEIWTGTEPPKVEVFQAQPYPAYPVIERKVFVV